MWVHRDRASFGEDENHVRNLALSRQRGFAITRRRTRKRRQTPNIPDQRKFTLRSLRGIDALEGRLRRIEEHPNPNWAPEREGLKEYIQELCTRLFGIRYYREPTAEEVFKAFRRPYAINDDDEFVFASADQEWDDDVECYVTDAEMRKALLRWDLTDGRGKPLRSATYLLDVIVLVTLGRVGRLPGAHLSEEEAKREADDWGKGLAAEAAKFRRGNG